MLVSCNGPKRNMVGSKKIILDYVFGHKCVFVLCMFYLDLQLGGRIKTLG